MERARARRARALVVVARILMQQSRQHRAAQNQIGESVGVHRAKSLTVAFRALLIIRRIAGLVHAGQRGGAHNVYRVNQHAPRQLVLQLGRQRHGILVVHHVKIRNESKHALLLGHLNLFQRNLLVRPRDGNRSCLAQNRHAPLRHDVELARVQRDVVRGPRDKALRAHRNAVWKARFQPCKAKSTVAVGGRCACGVARLQQRHRCAGNDVVIGIGDRAADGTGLLCIAGLRGFGLRLVRQCLGGILMHMSGHGLCRGRRGQSHQCAQHREREAHSVKRKTHSYSVISSLVMQRTLSLSIGRERRLP